MFFLFCFNLFVEILTEITGSSSEFTEHQGFELGIWEMAFILFSPFIRTLSCSFIWGMLIYLLILAASLCLFLCIR